MKRMTKNYGALK